MYTTELLEKQELVRKDRNEIFERERVERLKRYDIAKAESDLIIRLNNRVDRFNIETVYTNDENSMSNYIQNNCIKIIQNLVLIMSKDNRNILIAHVLKDLDIKNTDIFDLLEAKYYKLTIAELINLVWKFISLLNNFENAKLSLRESIITGCDVCVTGMATRIINSIQGYFDENVYPELVLKIKPEDEIIVKLSYIITRELIRKQLDPLYDTERAKNLVENVIDDNIDIVYLEYTDIKLDKKTMKNNLIGKYF